MACCAAAAYLIMRMLNLYHALDENIRIFNVKSCHPAQTEPISGTKTRSSTCRLYIRGMTCMSCSTSIANGLNNTVGVSKARVSHSLALATIMYNPCLTTVEMLTAKVYDLGFDASIAPEKSSWQSSFIAAETAREKDIQSWQSSAMLSLWATMPALTLRASQSFGALTRYSLVCRSLDFIFAGFAVFYCASRVHKEALVALKAKREDMSLLSSAGLLAGFLQPALKSVLYFQHSSQITLSGVCLLTTIILGGRLLKVLVSRRSLATLAELTSSMPKTALLAGSRDPAADWYEAVTEIPIELVEAGDWVVVSPNTAIAVDGVVVRGDSSVLETNVRGEILPKFRRQGDVVFAGSINQSAPIIVEVRCGGPDTWLEKTLALVASSNSDKAVSQDVGLTLIRYFVRVVFGLTIVNLIFLRALGISDWGVCLDRTTAILLCACPCALGLSVPSCSMIAIATCSRVKILLVAASAQINLFAGVKTVLFDKTGTLTFGRLEITSALLHEAWNASQALEAQFWTAVVSLEQRIPHPVARAVLSEGKRRFPSIIPAETQQVKQEPGLGVQGLVRSGDRWLHVALGNGKFMQSLNVCSDTCDASGTLGSFILISIDRKYAGKLTFDDHLRPDAQSVVQILKQQGINVGILTGASQKSADTIAQTLNISHEWVWADLLPHGKVKILEDVKKQYGHVCMVGDNVNDLAALSAASFSIFMSESTGPTAGAGADAILLPDPTSQELMRIPWLLQLTRATTQCMWQNIGWAVFYNVSAIALSSGILEFFHPILTLTPSGASLAMGLSSVVILVNSMRLENWHSTLLDYQMVHRTD